MVKSKKGFTLMEVLVVVFISTLLITMVAASIIYISKTTAKLIQEAEEIEMARNIANYFELLEDEDFSRLTYKEDIGIVLYEDYVLSASSDLTYKSKNIIFSETGLEKFQIYRVLDTGFIFCSMEFQSGRTFEYIIGYCSENLA